MNPNGDSRARPACPQCASQYVIRYGKNSAGNDRYACKKCLFQFVRVVEEAERHEGSGVIAGKITIGRGYNWKAGLV